MLTPAVKEKQSARNGATLHLTTEMRWQRGKTILQYLADGVRITEIPRELGLSIRPVKHSLSWVTEQLGADTTAQAVAMALRRKLIE